MESPFETRSRDRSRMLYKYDRQLVELPECWAGSRSDRARNNRIIHLRPSLLLFALALIGTLVGNIPCGAFFSVAFATAYTMPLTNPTKMADTLGIVTGASKKTNPETAMGSLLSAPTIEYVVDDVALTHHADV